MSDNDTWNQQQPDHAPSNPNGNSAGPTGDEGWGGGGQSPPPRRSRSPPPRRSRSKSPARGRDGGRREGGGGGEQRDGDGGTNPGNNLHVSGLSSRIDNRELESIFSKVGKVKKAAVMYDPHTRESRGFGFVTMETAEDADAVIAALNATEVFGKMMNVEKARRGRARTPTPGRYYGPPKRPDYERPYDPRPYDSRYYDSHRGGGGYDDRYGGRDRYGPPPRDYDRRDRRYDDRRSHYDRRDDYDRRY